MKVAYLSSMYPDVSHTFITREVDALRARGIDVGTFSVRRPGERNILGPDARREAAGTRWLVPPRAGGFLRALAWSSATRPRLQGRAFLAAVGTSGMSMAQRLKWFCYFGEAHQLAYWLVKEAFEHLHCHFGNAGASTGMLAARIAGIPFSMTCHGSELLEIERFRLREKVARARFVACVSYFGKAQLMRVCPPEDWARLHVVRCGVPRAPESEPAFDDGPARILCVGRLSPEKGHLVLLDALAMLRDWGVAFSCVMVGEGPMRSKIEQRVCDLDLAEALTLTGALPAERVADSYEVADVVASASFSEGVPVVLMEAMAHGRPVVATHVGGVAELVQDGRDGLLVPPGDAEALAGALRRIVTDPEFARGMGRCGVQTVRGRFDVGAAADDLVALLQQAHRPGVGTGAGADSEEDACPHLATARDS